MSDDEEVASYVPPRYLFVSRKQNAKGDASITQYTSGRIRDISTLKRKQDSFD